MVEMKNQEPLSQRRSMRSEIAKRHIEAFSKRFGEDHLILAQHAAFPLALTPDLLYLLWANFRHTIRAPWIAVADLLLSGLCEEVGHELYEMNTGVRSILLDDLKHKFGLERVNELSNFILNYIEQQLESDDPYIRDLASTQRWIALAYIRPGDAAHEIAEALRTSIKQKDRIEQMRMADLIETTAEPLADFAPLLTYARGIVHLIQNDIQSAQAQFSKIVEQESTISIQGVPLPIPVQIQATIQHSVQPQVISYVSAKVVLLGDSGVGKSGLGLVLSNQPFLFTESTHARRIWTFDKQEVTLDEGRKENRETLLWDLAGQSEYQLIHQLHLNEVAVALVVFDARSETDPFAGIYHWDRALRQAQSIQGSSALPLKKILVQARADRGGVGVSQERIQALIDECGFDGYFATSAKEGLHIKDLREAVCNAINWDALPKISSTQLFQNIKAFLLQRKRQADTFQPLMVFTVHFF